MKEITYHKSDVSGDLNDKLSVIAIDVPGEGNAHSVYVIKLPNNRIVSSVKFQMGPIQESTMNGVTNEAVLSILIDRLKSFQQGKFPCEENAIALSHLQEAMNQLHNRTKRRDNSHIEGTLQEDQ